MQLPDSYTFQARFVPVVVVVLPPLVLLATGLITSTRVGIATGACLTVVSGVFSQLGRDLGKKLEPGLWESWGGEPTLRRLRYEGAADASAVGRLHGRIERVLGDPLPTVDDETRDPGAADSQYREATRRLIARTTDHDRFPLVFAENVNYGMRRNLLGLRRIGVLLSALTAVAALLLLLLVAGALQHRVARYAPALGVALGELAFWGLVVTPNWVMRPAEEYADRLMESVELLPLAEAPA